MREIAAVAALGARHVLFGDDDYPALLAEIDTAPAALIVAGDLGLTRRPVIAIVGARNASAASLRFARMLAHDLADQKIAIVSGLARGIDTAAHEGALAGGTIGVIAGGPDIFYPPENEALQRRIATQGLIIAEQPPGTEPRARHFPSRNRIIAGLAQGTVVVEAAPKSGSLITARLAAECGRDVMAVPGSPLDPRSQGCNQLIRDGAILVQSAADVIETLRPFGETHVHSAPSDYGHAPPPQEVAPGDRTRIADLLGPSPVPVDELVRQSGLAPAAVHAVLLELELGGRLERHAGARVGLV